MATDTELELEAETQLAEFNTRLRILLHPTARSHDQREATLAELTEFRNELVFNDLTRRCASGELDEFTDEVDSTLSDCGHTFADLRNAIRRMQKP